MFTGKLHTGIGSPPLLSHSHLYSRTQQLFSSSWPSCMPVWDKNAITGNRNGRKKISLHTIELPPLTPPTHKWCCMDMHFIYKLSVNALDVWSQKYYFQSPVFTARQIHCQLSLHRATVTPDGFELNLRTRIPARIQGLHLLCQYGSPNSNHLSESLIKKLNCREIKLAVRRHCM